jgi:hypothetical protein
LVVAILCALAFVSAAWATTTYAGPKYWTNGQDAQTGYNRSWYDNNFVLGSSRPTTVTFIDADGYHWHNTSAITASANHTYWNGASGVLRLMYCKYRDPNGSESGSCLGN